MRLDSALLGMIAAAGAFAVLAPSAHAATLPAEYKELVYIEGTGTQYINTEYTPQSTDTIEMEMEFTGTGVSQAFWCARTDSTVDTFTFFWLTSGLRFDYNTANNAIALGTFTAAAAKRYHVKADGDTGSVTINDNVVYTYTPESFTVGGPLSVMASQVNGASPNNYGHYRLYSFTVTSGGTPAVDLVPAERVADGVLGVYDTARGTFYTNAGSGTFLRPAAKAFWTNAGGDGDASNPANWSCTDADGNTVAGGLPGENTSLVFSGKFAVQIPAETPVACSGVEFIENATLTADCDWRGLGSDPQFSGALELAGFKLTVAGLTGTANIGSTAGNLIANPGFETDIVSSGSYVGMTPTGWVTSGTVGLLKDHNGYGGKVKNGSNWCRTGYNSYIQQVVSVPQTATYTLTLRYGASRDTSNTYIDSFYYVSLDGAALTGDTRTKGSSNVAYSKTFTLSPGSHTIRMGCPKRYTNHAVLFDNVSLVNATLNKTSSGAGVLEVDVPEGETVTNSGITFSGSVQMKVHKTGKGKLVLSKVNTGFGARFFPSLYVKEGTVDKTTAGATCGAQYATITVEDGGQLLVGGKAYWDYNYNIAGAGLDGRGAIVNDTEVASPWTKSTSYGYIRNVVLAGDATIGGSKSWGLQFYNYSATTMAMNGHTVTLAGPVVLYAGNLSYSGIGRIVIANEATVEYYGNTPTAPNCELVVHGTLQQHDNALSPVKSLLFAADGNFNNTWTSRPLFVVRNTYAPNVNHAEGSQDHPTVQLGASGFEHTTLDLSLFTSAFDSATTTFFAGSEVTVETGARELADGEKIIAWAAIPESVTFIPSKTIERRYALSVRDDGLYAMVLRNDMPLTAVWTGNGEEGNLDDPQNWTCYNSDDEELADAIPAKYTTVVVSGETSFTVPEGASVPWGRVLFGDGEPKATQWGRIFYGGDRSAISGTAWYASTSLGEYTFLGIGDLGNLDGQNTGWQYSWLDWSQLRFDGWFKVTPAQAGRWHIRQYFDDYFAFAIDGEWVLVNPVSNAQVVSDVEVGEGWHRFTIICGDTNGGQGSNNITFGDSKVPMLVSANGASEVPFSASYFEMGAGQTVIKLGGDCDWRRLGRVALASGAVIDLNGHALTTVGLVCDGYVGATVKNSAAASGELRIEVPEGGTFTLEGVAIAGDVKLVKTGGGTLVAATACREFTGGTVVEEGVLKPALVGSKFPFGTANLLKNGSFDDGTAMYNNNGDWSYANGGNGFALPHWSGSNPGRYGLSKSSGTWVATGRNGNIAKYALFLQTSGNTVDVSQDVEVKAPGKYCYYFIYAGRPKYTGATTELRLIHNGASKTIASVTTSADTYSVCEGTVDLETAGTYTLQFYQPSTSGDKANTIDNVFFARCDTGMANGAVVVNEGATFEMNGKYDFCYSAFVLNGGTFQSASGTDIGSGTAQMKYMALTKDSTLNLQNHYGFIGNGYSRTYLDLGGNTLTVNLNAGGKLFYLYNTEVRDGVLDVIDGGWLETGNAGVTATNATIKCRAAMRANGAVNVRDYMAYRASSKHNEGTAAFKVYGTFTPATDIFYGCQMQNGSTVDLSGRTTVWNTTTAADSTAKGSTTVTFADNATITVNLYGREGLFALARSADPFVATWSADPANLEVLKFVVDAKSRKLGLKVVPDTLMVPGDEGQVEKKGLKLVYVGGSVFILR